MEIRRLEYFVCIAEQGSLGRASDLLRIAQPALTRQVRLLEQELGVILFTRSRRGMRLTEEGEQLLSEVMGPLRQLEGALQNPLFFFGHQRQRRHRRAANRGLFPGPAAARTDRG
jgi:LysR family transcriptional regulator, nitrogen assimilation regulatory protein